MVVAVRANAYKPTLENEYIALSRVPSCNVDVVIMSHKEEETLFSFHRRESIKTTSIGEYSSTQSVVHNQRGVGVERSSGFKMYCFCGI